MSREFKCKGVEKNQQHLNMKCVNIRQQNDLLIFDDYMSFVQKIKQTCKINNHKRIIEGYSIKRSVRSITCDLQLTVFCCCCIYIYMNVFYVNRQSIECAQSTEWCTWKRAMLHNAIQQHHHNNLFQLVWLAFVHNIFPHLINRFLRYNYNFN